MDAFIFSSAQFLAMCIGIGWFLRQKDVQNVHFQQISTVHVQSTKSIQKKTRHKCQSKKQKLSPAMYFRH